LAVKKEPVPDDYNKKMLSFVNDVKNVTEYEKEILKKFDNRAGKPCTLCVDMCPIANPVSAIAMQTRDGVTKPEIYDGCIGCGVCEEVCPTSTPSIVIKPRVTYKEQYEKGKA